MVRLYPVIEFDCVFQSGNRSKKGKILQIPRGLSWFRQLPVKEPPFTDDYKPLLVCRPDLESRTKKPDMKIHRQNGKATSVGPRKY